MISFRMFENCLRVIILAALAAYLLSLAIGVYAEPVFRSLYTSPIKWFTDRRVMIRARENLEEGIRQNLYFYNLQRDGGKGVVALQEDRTYGDYTFFYSSHDKKAYLVDLHGKPVHQWQLDPAALPPDPDAWLPQRMDPWFPDAVWRAFLQPNGDVIAIYCGFESAGAVFLSKGIFRIDKDSNLLWVHRDRIHHDIVVLPDGSILTLTGKPGYRPYPGAPKLQPPYSRDFLVTLNGKGEEIQRISVLDLFANSPQKKFLEQLGTPDSPRLENGDLLHTNTITPVTVAAVARNPSFKDAEYLLSFRNFSLLAAIDLDQKTIVWASYGPWKGQHSPVFLPDGSLMMFDNLGNIGATGGLSRVLDVDTVTGEILWEYNGTDSDPVFGPYSSSVDPLPNGNVLVTETGAGRVFEVTRDKQIVWDYRSPYRLKAKRGVLLIPNLFGGKRFRKEDLLFLSQNGVQ